MDIIKINEKNVRLLLSRQRSKVRIADADGNHEKKPTIVKNVQSNYVEWMITNAQIQLLIEKYFSERDKKKLRARIELVNIFLNESEYATRKAKRTTALGNLEEFNIYKYEESFFSFEKVFNSNIKIKITFKMGDFTLAPHMFILLPFDRKVIELFNCDGEVYSNNALGSGCFAIWKPSADIICEAVEALAHASSGHKRDLFAMAS